MKDFLINCRYELHCSVMPLEGDWNCWGINFTNAKEKHNSCHTIGKNSINDRGMSITFRLGDVRIQQVV